MIRVVVDDLAFVAADAIVRPASATLEPTTAALRRLEHIGGPAFWNQLTVQADLPVGAAVVTDAGALPAGLVIHAIIRSATEPVSAGTVRRAVRSVLQRANDWQLAHIAIPPLGMGAGNLEVEAAAGALCAGLRDLGHGPYPSTVTIVVETPDERAVFESHVEQILR